jgi:hypothetical protein
VATADLLLDPRRRLAHPFHVADGLDFVYPAGAAESQTAIVVPLSFRVRRERRQEVLHTAAVDAVEVAMNLYTFLVLLYYQLRSK